jgi:hypothetical protein
MIKKSIGEIITTAARFADDKDRIEYLREHDSIPLRLVLKAAIDPNIKWNIPEGPVEYKKNQYPDAQGMLYSRARTLYMFIDGHGNHINEKKRQTLFAQLLETVMPEDAEVLLLAKDKKLWKTLSKKVFNKAFNPVQPIK